MTNKDTFELYGRVVALEAILANLVWRFAQSQGDQILETLATVMMNAEANLSEATARAVGTEERAIGLAAEEAFGRLTENLTREIAKTAPETRGH